MLSRLYSEWGLSEQLIRDLYFVVKRDGSVVTVDREFGKLPGEAPILLVDLVYKGDIVARLPVYGEKEIKVDDVIGASINPEDPRIVKTIQANLTTLLGGLGSKLFGSKISFDLEDPRNIEPKGL